MRTHVHAFFAVLALAQAACSQTPPAPTTPPPQPQPPAPTAALDWKSLESPLITDHVQVTSRDSFVKAGEAYFDHNSPPRWIIFQAVPLPQPGKDPDAFYAMYVAKLTRDPSGRITGTESPIKVSPDGAANTCGWFHPVVAGNILFASTGDTPVQGEGSGYQRSTGRYRWEFPVNMRIAKFAVSEITADAAPPGPLRDAILHHKHTLTFHGGGGEDAYRAECSYSPDGRYLLFARMVAPPRNTDIYLYDARTRSQQILITSPGYDGGPFFSRDGKRICFRSDRRGDDLLQLFIADINFDREDRPDGITREHQITDNQHVNWAPYWHPSGKFLVYATSEIGHTNYEVFAVEAPAPESDSKPADLRRRRVTFANGADILPAFSDDGTLVMWTAQRGPVVAGESRPSSQVWIARVNPAAGGFSDPDHLFDNPPDQSPERASTR